MKVEILSPPSSIRNFDDFSQTKKLDLVNKWRTRVLFCSPRDSYDNEEESLLKKIEKLSAIFRVTFPFLTDRQIRGKAWQSCGFNSIMGSTPRHGLSPGVKRELMKRRSSYHCTMSQKSKYKRESIKIEKDDDNCINCPYTFDSPNGQLFISSKVSESSNCQLQDKDSIPLERGDSPGCANEKEVLIDNVMPMKLNFTKPVFTAVNVSSIPKTTENSVKSTSPFCSQPINPDVPTELNTVVTSLVVNSNFNAEAHLSKCLSSLQSKIENIEPLPCEFPKPLNDVSPSLKSLEPEDVYIAPSLFKFESVFDTLKVHQRTLGQAGGLKINLSDNLQDEKYLIESTTNFFMEINKNEKMEDFNKQQDSELYWKNSVSYQECTNLSEEIDIPVSLPTTPEFPKKYQLPGSVLLSNYSSEYEQAYAKRDLNPSVHRNYCYTQINKTLKAYFDEVIPPNQSLQTFFAAKDKSFKKIKNGVQRNANTIILRIEENDTDEETLDSENKILLSI